MLHIKANWEAIPRLDASAFVLFKSERSAEPRDWRDGILYTIRVDQVGTLAQQPLFNLS